MNTKNIDQMIRAFDEGSFSQRTQAMQDVCPCRNEVRDRGVWARVFEAAHEPGKVRVRAIHAIATLLNRAEKSARWREVLSDFEQEMDSLMADPEACRLLRLQVQHDPKAKGDLTPAANTRKLARAAWSRPSEMAEWLNRAAGHARSDRVPSGHAGLDRLWRWYQNRITVESQRKLDPAELLGRARQWLPEFVPDEIDPATLPPMSVRENGKSREGSCDLPSGQPRDRAFAWLESSNAGRRARGLKRLAAIGAADLFEWCEMFLEDPSDEVRLAALRAMLACGSIDAEVVTPLADSEDVRIRAAATAVLARHECAEDVRWFELGLKDPSPCVRVETASVMNHLDRDSHPVLFEIALHDPNPEVVRHARKATAS